MAILFTLITARKNKGLAMQVVPKIVEGWHVKYVTGSGQTRLTANRVQIFEFEGNTKANHRGKVKAKKKPVTKRSGRGRSNSLTSESTTRKRRRKSIGSEPASKKQALDSTVSSVVEDQTDADDDDDDDSSINEDIQQTFQEWQESDGWVHHTSNQVDLDLSRSNSVFDLHNTSTELTPSELQRGVSWTEIPISVLDSSNSSTLPFPAQPSLQPAKSFSQFPPSVSCSFEAIDYGNMSPPMRMMSSHYYPSNQPFLGQNACHEDMSSQPLETKAVWDLFPGYSSLTAPRHH
eukprot:scaffold1493_cov172-Ochromonas_danica.AAC.14